MELSQKAKIALTITAAVPLLIIAAMLICPGIIKGLNDSILKDMTCRRFRKGAVGINVSMNDFNFTKYAGEGVRAEKVFTLTGRKMGLESRKTGLFRIALNKGIYIRDVEIVFFDNNVPVSTVTSGLASAGIMAASSEKDGFMPARMDLEDNVRIVAADGSVLTSGSAKLDLINEKILARDGCVLKIGTGETVRARAMNIDVSLKDYEVVNDRSTRIGRLARMIF